MDWELVLRIRMPWLSDWKQTLEEGKITDVKHRYAVGERRPGGWGFPSEKGGRPNRPANLPDEPTRREETWWGPEYVYVPRILLGVWRLNGEAARPVSVERRRFGEVTGQVRAADASAPICESCCCDDCLPARGGSVDGDYLGQWTLGLTGRTGVYAWRGWGGAGGGGGGKRVVSSAR